MDPLRKGDTVYITDEDCGHHALCGEILMVAEGYVWVKFRCCEMRLSPSQMRRHINNTNSFWEGGVDQRGAV
jgi:hypothetical protein